jgi:thermitase
VKIKKMKRKSIFSRTNLSFLIVCLMLLFLFWENAPTRLASASSQDETASSKNEVILEIASLADARTLAAKYSLAITPLAPSDQENFFLARSLKGETEKKLIKKLQKEPRALSVQKNFHYILLSKVPNDSYAGSEWPLFDASRALGGMSAFSSWDAETKNGQRNVAIAVIDSGANTAHKDLKNNLTKGSAKGKNFEYPKKKMSDSDGHGTFLSGIIGGVTNNKRGISGGSFFNHLRIMPLRFDFTTSQAITALNYANSKSVPVINASWGSYGSESYDLALKDAIANYSGIFVTAAGNSRLNHDDANPNHKMYPCDFELPNIICVAASDRNGNLTNYSDFGSSSVDVAAPGGTDGDEIMGLDKKTSKYTTAEGSSISTAFVSAEAGLLLSKFPNLSSTQIIEIIKNSVDQNFSFAGKVLSGGRVNFQKALATAANY